MERIGRMLDALLGSLAGLTALPSEPSTPERTDAARARLCAAELERAVVARLPRQTPGERRP
jgi:hypothetical protein